VLGDGVVNIYGTEQFDLHAGLTFRSGRVDDREVVVTEDRLVVVEVREKPVDFFRSIASRVEGTINRTVTSDVASERLVVCREAVNINVTDDPD